MENTFLSEYLEILGYYKMPKELEKYLLTPSLVRLKNVGYFCGMDFASKDIYNFEEKISRYDHSLSVALLTWMLTKNIKATIAGLFHDISTPCFSHVIDYMNKDYDKQESTEEKTEEIIKNDKYLLNCLNQDNISVDEIINFKKYSIVDLDRPMLCADRLDGVILTGLFWTKSLDIFEVRDIIDNVIVILNEYGQEEIGFKDKIVAELVLKTSELIDVYCHSKEDNYMMELLAEITKRGLDLNLISYENLFALNEEQIFEIFDISTDERLKQKIDLFRNILISDIPIMDMPYVKIRNLNPIVLNRRLK